MSYHYNLLLSISCFESESSADAQCIILSSLFFSRGRRSFKRVRCFSLVAVPIIPEFLYVIRHQKDLTTTTRGPETTPFPIIFNDNGTGVSEPTPTFDYGDLRQKRDVKVPETDEERKRRQKHNELVQENVEVGVMFASKAMVQLIANPFVGPLTNR